MAQADSKNSTDAPVNPTRRRVLFQAAGVAAGSAVLTMATASPASANAAPAGPLGGPDPIFTLIADHKVAQAELQAACGLLGDLEETIPEDRQKGETRCFEVQIVETDDPRWTAANIRYNASVIKADEIALEMINVAPTSLAGVQAMMLYAAEFVEAGNLWPDGSQIEDEDEDKNGKSRLVHRRDWNYYLLRNLAEAAGKLAA